MWKNFYPNEAACHCKIQSDTAHSPWLYPSIVLMKILSILTYLYRGSLPFYNLWNREKNHKPSTIILGHNEKNFMNNSINFIIPVSKYYIYKSKMEGCPTVFKSSKIFTIHVHTWISKNLPLNYKVQIPIWGTVEKS